jgi:Icc-related predicted phosphoesterase
MMKILVVSDVVIDWIYSPQIRAAFADVDLIISCGDLPAYYLEYLVSTLDKPLLLVHGNHSIAEEVEAQGNHHTIGAQDIHCKEIVYGGYSFAGVEGSLRYNNGAYQYSQAEMWINCFRIIPALLMNRVRYGKYLDVFVSHAPQRGIHDRLDLTHQGIDAFRWLVNTFQPDYHIHGHIHVYRPDTVTETDLGKTRVINAYGYRMIELGPRQVPLAADDHR